MKLSKFIDKMCDTFNMLIGCEKCPHNKCCSGGLEEEINEKADFELEKYK